MIDPRFLSALCCTFICSCQLAAAASEDWQDAASEVRVPIVVASQPGAVPRRPIIVRWARVAAALGDAQVRPSSLRLFGEGKRQNFQVDHRDADGNLLAPGNLTLDPQDELVFVCPADRQTTLHLYGSAEPRPPVTPSSTVQMTLVRHGAGRVHYRLTSGELSIGIQGAGALDTDSHTPINYGRGSVVELTWLGRSAIWPSMNWSVYMNGHPFVIERWRRVRAVVDGPVRKVVAVDGLGKQETDDQGEAVRRVDVTRYFSMFEGCPLYDIEDVIKCRQVQPAYTITYTDRFFAGGRLDAADVLWEGSSGAARQFVLADKDIQANRNGRLVNTKQVVAGWCAWYDTAEHTGLAVFYGPVGPTAVRYDGGWEWYSSVSRMSFAYEGLKAPTTLRHRFRIVGLAGVESKQVAAEHDMWRRGRRPSATIGRLQRRR